MSPDALADLPVDEVAIHSRQKHALLEAYLRVWTQNVAANWGVASPSLDIYDLFAGTGQCVEREYRKDRWSGTAMLSAEQLKVYPSRSKCVLFLNSWAEDPLECSRNLDALRQRVHVLGLERPNRVVQVISEEISNALTLALRYQSSRKQYPSLWILDPYAASDLPWTSVERIANQVGSYRTKDGDSASRRPELFINFMTSSLQRNIHNLPMVTRALGCSVGEWEGHLQHVESDGGTFLDALTVFYFSQLRSLYGRDPATVTIPGKDGNPVSVVFLAVERPAAWYSIKKESIPYFEHWREHKYQPRKEWVRKRHKIDRNMPKGQKQTELENSYY
jgi:three-Cys-motif partner protein